MKLVKFVILILAFFGSINISTAQTDSSNCRLRISVLTCAPGSELYSTFGHTAIRVIDSTQQLDLVFNWGTFDFNDPNFYLKFIRGKLDYILSVDKYNDFIVTYQEEQRSIWEQELELTCKEKLELFAAMKQNLQGANRFYKYDFLFDNCTTRVRDMVFKNIPGLRVTDSLTLDGVTFRNQIHEYLDEGAKPWSKLGIDILLGSKLDKNVNNWDAMFLPDYLMQGLDVSNLADEGIIHPSTLIYKATPQDIRAWKYAPLLIFSLFFALLIAFSFMHKPWAIRITKIADSLFLYITGVLGFLLIFMWFGTDHTICKNNYNLIWALPFNFIAAFFIWKRPLWVRRYFYAAALLYGLLLLSWFWLPQQINIALIPLTIYMLLRCSKLATGK